MSGMYGEREEGMENKIYDMKLHECIDSGTKVNMYYTILRVAGGWIYTSFNHDGNSLSSTFIPFDNEFKLP